MQYEITTNRVDAPIDAYVATPTGPGRHPLVVVGFELFGITGYVRSVADRIARRGYTAVVPDFYHRLGERIELPADPAGRTRGLELLHGLDRDGVRDDVRAVVDHFGGGPAGLVGMSAGGHLGFYAATQVPFGALAVLYPGWLTGTDIPVSRPEPTIALAGRLKDFGTRLLILTGERDHLVTADTRAEIGRALTEAGVDHELVVYPDAPHGFFCDERETHDPAAAADAWRRIDDLLAGLRAA